ncbi:hypothetical protein EDB89DRAFT_1913741 [Lactarius sanguifluus]|nr:hypothetical protein EDB89DRAFT_1913741 [Lactarius sanguifluus]
MWHAWRRVAVVFCRRGDNRRWQGWGRGRGICGAVLRWSSGSRLTIGGGGAGVGGELTIVRGGGAARWVATAGLGNVAGVTVVARSCATCAVLGLRRGLCVVAKVGLANRVGGAVVVGLACRDVAPGAFARRGTCGRGCGWRETGATSDAWRNGGADAAVTWFTPMRNNKEKKKKKLNIEGRGSPEFARRVVGGGELAWAKRWQRVMCGKAAAVTWLCDKKNNLSGCTGPKPSSTLAACWWSSWLQWGLWASVALLEK